MMTPPVRTLRHLRRAGYTAAVVETWIPHVNRRRDLFGFADVLAAGVKVALHGWRRVGQRRCVKVVEVRPEELSPVVGADVPRRRLLPGFAEAR
jgi:hypothetical protein